MRTARQVARVATSTWLLVLMAISSAHLLAQEHGATRSKPATARSASDQNGTNARPTHDPQPDLRPLFAWNFVMKGNADYVAARREKARLHSNKLAQPIVTRSHHDATTLFTG